MKYWNTNIFTTYLLNGFSIYLPAGERFFIATMQEALKFDLPQSQIEDITQFIKEEQAHQRAHIRYNDSLQEKGYPIDVLEAPIIKDLEKMSNTLSLKQKIAFMAAFEYLTMMLSKIILKNPTWLTENKCLQADLWRWHCKEEIEHHHVAVELLKTFKVGYFLRTSMFAIACVVMLYDTTKNIFTFYKIDKKTKNTSLKKTLGDFLKTAWHSKIDGLKFAFACCKYFLPFTNKKYNAFVN